jgi:hypothetical protein
VLFLKKLVVGVGFRLGSFIDAGTHLPKISKRGSSHMIVNIALRPLPSKDY